MAKEYCFPACEFSPASAYDDLLLTLSLLEAARYSEASYVGYVQLSDEDVERLKAEGRERTEMNKKRMGVRWVGTAQKIEGCDLTADELGRICEGAIESIIPLNVEAVVTGVDARPDLILGRFRKTFDIKSSFRRHEPTFSIAQRVAHKYGALVLTQYCDSGKVHIWACKSDTRGWEPRKGNQGRGDFYLIRCPEPAEKVLH